LTGFSAGGRPYFLPGTVDYRTSRTTMMINNIKPAEPPPIQTRLPTIGDIINGIKFGG
jgi:hypothetical protein